MSEDSDKRSKFLLRTEIEEAIFDRLSIADCVVLIGPRQVGKSTIARKIEELAHDAIFLDLQKKEDREWLSDLTEFLALCERNLLILDEAQVEPALFPALRVEIDRRRHSVAGEHGKFLLLGSASEKLLQLTQALTGRFSKVDLGGFHLLELLEDLRLKSLERTFDALDERFADQQSSTKTVANLDINTLWFRGGMPESYLAASDHQSFQWRRDYIENYVDRELQALGYKFDSLTFRRVWEMVASRSANLWDSHDCSKSLKVSADAVNDCLAALIALGFVRELRPWFKSLDKQLTKMSKFYRKRCERPTCSVH